MKKRSSFIISIVMLLIACMAVTGCVNVNVTHDPVSEKPKNEISEIKEIISDIENTSFDGDIDDLPEIIDDLVEEESEEEQRPAVEVEVTVTYHFRNQKLLNQHFEKHGIEMGFATAEEYESAASAVINDPRALTKTEAEDGDYVFYIEETNEFVVLSQDGYIRTYFLPSSGKAYYDRQ